MQNGSLFSLSIRDVPVLWKNGPYIFPKFVENLTGEDFIFQRNKQQIRAALKNVNLNAGLLAVENPPVIENPFGSAKQQRCNVEV